MEASFRCAIVADSHFLRHVASPLVEAALTEPGIGLVQDRLRSDLAHPVHRRRRQSPETEGLTNP